MWTAILKTRPIRLPHGKIVVSYGSMPLLFRGHSANLSGGRVKLAYLQIAYPDHVRSFNILYLASSALPRHCDLIIKWAKAGGAKVVLNQNGVGYPGWTSSYVEINTQLAEVNKLADLVLYQTEFCQKAVERFIGPCQSKAATVLNCTDIARFRPSSLPRKKEQELRLLVAGTHFQSERVTIPLQVLRLLLDSGICARLVIAGELKWAEAYKECRQLVADLGLEAYVTLTGHFSYDTAHEIYVNSDMLLHLKYKDPCPTVVIEAMACGLPVIGSSTGGLPELVGPNAGILIAVPDSWERMYYPKPAEVAMAVRKIASTLVIYSTQARRFAEEHFDHNTWLSTHTRHFSDLLGIK